MTDAAIRPARTTDLAALGAIEQSGVETFAAYGAPLADGSAPADPDHWRSVLASGLLWVADHSEDGPVGFLAAERAGGGLYVAEVDVAMPHQRRGLGRRLMQAAIERARSEGLAEVTLTTFRSIPWNAPFYGSLGFVELTHAAMPPHLAAHLADEAERGLDDRCGMRLVL